MTHAAKITQAMILAAGFGTRLRPITDHVPKAMVKIAGKPLLDHALDRLCEIGCESCVVNTHYLPDIIENHLASRKNPRIEISHEPEILETGGGILQALNRFHNQPFFAINADSLWRDFKTPLLKQLSDVWDDARMDGLLALVQNRGQYPELSGDFFKHEDGSLYRQGMKKPLPHIYIGVQILHPRLFDQAPDGKFSLGVLYDHASLKGRLYGHIAQNTEWFHISAPRDLAETERQWG